MWAVADSQSPSGNPAGSALGRHVGQFRPPQHARSIGIIAIGQYPKPVNRHFNCHPIVPSDVCIFTMHRRTCRKRRVILAPPSADAKVLAMVASCFGISLRYPYHLRCTFTSDRHLPGNAGYRGFFGVFTAAEKNGHADFFFRVPPDVHHAQLLI